MARRVRGTFRESYVRWNDTLSTRHCERSEAIQNPSAERLWTASLRPQ